MATKQDNLTNDSIIKLRDNILGTLLQDPLLSDLSTEVTLGDIRYKIRAEEEGFMKLNVKKFDGTTLSKLFTNR